MKNAITCMIVLLLICGFFCSCSTKPRTCSLSGNVILTNDTGNSFLDPIDYSGVTVALYELAELDTTLVRINNRFPSTGVIISQETEFDHRNSDPIKVVSTNADGTFSMQKIDSGSYNLVILKEGWGIRYVFDYHLDGGENLEIVSVELFPAQEFDSAFVEEFTFKTDHTYLLQNDVSFITDVTIEPRAMIYANPGCMIRFYGELTTPQSVDMSQAWKMLSARDIYATTSAPIDVEGYVGSIAFYGASQNLSYGIINHLGSGMLVNSTNITINDMIFRNFASGISVPQGVAVMDNVLIAYGLDNGTNSGLSLTSDQPEHTQISSCVFSSMHQGVVINSIGTFGIEDCYFHSNFRAITVATCPGTISHNSFEKNQFDIQRNSGSGLTTIDYNNFYDTTRTTIRPIGLVTANNNNFYKAAEHFINIYSNELPNNSTVPGDMDAKYNYWAVIDIENYLYDAMDNPDHSSEPCAFYIIYNPRRNSPVPDAGIQ